MINKIKRLKSIGKFYDFSASGEGLGWNKNTLLYAPNAYGKSTVVDVLRSLRDNNPNLVRARQTLGSPTPPEAVIIVDGTDHRFEWNHVGQVISNAEHIRHCALHPSEHSLK